MRWSPLVTLVLVVCGNCTYAAIFPDSGPTTPGSRAAVCGEIALAPTQAPLAVKRAIWAANQLRSKPYRYGGGHASFHDSGYDCSGTISYALGGAGLISSPMSCSDFRRYGQRGQGRWITVYARNGHTFAVIAGAISVYVINYGPWEWWVPFLILVTFLGIAATGIRMTISVCSASKEVVMVR